MANESPNRENQLSALTEEKPTQSNAIQIPEISLPKGGGALKGIDEKFEVNAANGTAGFSIPLPVSPGRNGFSLSLALSYNSGAGNSPFGMGWSLGYPSIQRKTDKKLPRYQDGVAEDVFMFSGVEDLVPALKNEGGRWIADEFTVDGIRIRKYRPRIEGAFSRIEKISHPEKGVYWKVTTRDNVTTFLGRTADSRIADPDDGSRIFTWLPEFSYDDKGNWMQYAYEPENLENVRAEVHEKNRLGGVARFTNQYLKRVKYGNKTPYFVAPDQSLDPPLPVDQEHFFELILDYGEHRKSEILEENEAPTYEKQKPWPCRPDAFSSYRSGFEIRTYRRCFGALLFHHFSGEAEFGVNYLVRSLDFQYQPSSINDSGETEVSYLQSITQRGYIRRPDGTYSRKSLPPLEFEYQQLQWNKAVRDVDRASIVHAPVGLTNNYQWVDLYGEGISGILTEQAEGWFYKSNLGDLREPGQVQFTPAKEVIPKPSLTGLSTGVLSLQDLEADGRKQVVVNSPELQGYFELKDGTNWRPFEPFEEVAQINFRDPNIRLIDLNGDGQPELVVSEDEVFLWYAAKGKKGHHPAEWAAKTFDEEKGPAIVFADQEQSIFLADMSGDGLTDIVRIRNGEICYWANKGYGRFSAKVSMKDAPRFDHPDLFNPQYLHLADVSGTGPTDIVYLGKNKFKAFLNLSGNAWSAPYEIEPFLPVDNHTRLSVIDLLGTGTSCIVWSSDLPDYAGAPMRYIDLMNSRKPHVMVGYQNNFGKEVKLEYKSSTYYYLKDKLEGKPWITKLPFPVQVVSKQVVEEKITDVRFTSEYRYHHGYYDHPEREFRGFGMVEQIDTERYETWSANNAGNQLEPSEELYQPPVLTKTWFHTGAFLDKEKILTHFETEYWYHGMQRQGYPVAVSEPQLPDARITAVHPVDSLNAEEWREALRACKGMTLRQEVFALDADIEGGMKTQLSPYTVATHNCHVQMLQPREDNPHAVFLVTESEALTLHYERDTEDPRTAHTLNLRLDEYGNVLDSAAVVYRRSEAKIRSSTKALGSRVTDFAGNTQQQEAFRDNLESLRDAQRKTWITFTRNAFTNDAIEPAGTYRLRLPCETRTYEVSDLEKTGEDLYRVADFNPVVEGRLPEIAYHEAHPVGEPCLRLIEHVQSTFYGDDLETELPLGQIQSLAIPYQSYQLAYTPDLLTHIYGDHLPADATEWENLLGTNDNDSEQSQCKFVHRDDDNWWIRSGTVAYLDTGAGETVSDARSRFFVPLSYTDPFGSTTKVFYHKDYYLVLEAVEDELGNRSQGEAFNFRTLSPQRIRDINDNLSEALVDELGLLKATALLGKDLDLDGIAELETADNLTDHLETTEEEKADIEAFFNTDNSDAIEAIARRLLGAATSRLIYDFAKYRRDGQPTAVATISREQHHSVNPESPLQIRFEYSDGLGKVAMAKAQAEPGDAKILIIEPENTFRVETVNTKPLLRWIGNGRTVLNNKGKPVKQYEPYFSVSPFYEDAKELVEGGVTPVFYYDPLGRLIKTVFPDQTFSKIEFDSWQQTTFDQNDTLSADHPWYAARAGGALGDKEAVAAAKALAHRDTPAAVFLDTLGRPVLSLAHNGRDEAGKEKWYTTWIELDIESNTRLVRDARGNAVMTYGYDMLGHRVYQNSMDAGERWMLNNAMGKPLMAWDSRDHIFTYAYDELQRPIWTKVQGGEEGDLDHIYERIFYGETNPDAKSLNLRGQPYEHYDTASKIQFEAYDFKGNLLRSHRRLARDYKNTVNWTGDLESRLESPDPANVFTTAATYDALNRVVTSTTPDGSITRPGYNEAGLLENVNVQHGAGNPIATICETAGSGDIVCNIDYNEKGQRTRIQYGNGVRTRYTYDPLTFRLIRLHTYQPSGGGAPDRAYQDLHYTYDPVGNITEIEDRCIPVKFYNNFKIEPRSKYTYDPLYRLIQATGKEHATTVSFGPTDNWNDQAFKQPRQPGNDMAWRPYTQSYQYDPVGNIEIMNHQAGPDGSWNRTYQYETLNNRLQSTQVGTHGHEYRYPHHPTHGFITTMPHLQVMQWNFRDELHAVSKERRTNGDTPETTYYVYDASGQRIRKVTERAATNGNTPTIKQERLYLGGLEIFHRYSNGGDTDLVRQTLHVMDNTRRIAMIDTRTEGSDEYAAQLTRYQLGNHLGSAALELSENAEVISYEEYHPYGTTAYQANNQDIKAIAKRYRYTGMERDEESGLGYHSARYYLAWLGRWGSVDPIGIKVGGNLYSYTTNPFRFTDISGKNDKPLRPGLLERAWGWITSRRRAAAARAISTALRGDPEGDIDLEANEQRGRVEGPSELEGRYRRDTGRAIGPPPRSGPTMTIQTEPPPPQFSQEAPNPPPPPPRRSTPPRGSATSSSSSGTQPTRRLGAPPPPPRRSTPPSDALDPTEYVDPPRHIHAMAGRRAQPPPPSSGSPPSGGGLGGSRRLARPTATVLDDAVQFTSRSQSTRVASRATAEAVETAGDVLRTGSRATGGLRMGARVGSEFLPFVGDAIVAGMGAHEGWVRTEGRPTAERVEGAAFVAYWRGSNLDVHFHAMWGWMVRRTMGASFFGAFAPIPVATPQIGP